MDGVRQLDQVATAPVDRVFDADGGGGGGHPRSISLKLSSPTVTDPEAVAQQAAAAIRERTGVDDHDVAVILGSGWAPAAAELGAPTAVLPVAELPGFTPPTADGHGGEVLSVRTGEHRVLVFVGRVHAYEGHDLSHVVHPVRAACAAGVRTVVLTNAAGGIRADFAVGQPVLISDHLNLTARSPLVGAQFVDLVDAYSPRLRALAREVDPDLAEGVYACLPGPHYETPAEIRMLRTLGADLVGMSTVHETIAARAAGAQVLGGVAGDESGRGRHRAAAEPRGSAGRRPSIRDADGLPAGLGDLPALTAEALGQFDHGAGQPGRGEQHQQDAHHLRRNEECDVRSGLHRGRHDGVDPAGAGGEISLERSEPGDIGQHDAEAGGGDAEHDDQADRRRQ